MGPMGTTKKENDNNKNEVDDNDDVEDSDDVNNMINSKVGDGN